MTDKPVQPNTIRFASLTAHQLRAPIAAVQSILRTLLGDFAGPLNDKQRQMLVRADARCEQAVESIRRMLAIANAMEQTHGVEEVTDLAAVAREALLRYAESARRRDVSLLTHIDVEPAYVSGNRPALTEAVEALLDNALKYTPDHGRIRLEIRPEAGAKTVRLAVSDSGVGIAKKDRQRIFEPFVRTRSAGESSRPGTGLGLSFVKAVVASAGGSIQAGKADLGGAELVMELPAADRRAAQPDSHPPVARGMRVVLVGGVTAGPKVAAKIIRLMPNAEVTVVEKGQFMSYAGCGLPYYVSGVVRQQKELMSTPLGAVRDPVFFQNVKNVRIMNQTEALEIDRRGKRLLIRGQVSGHRSWLQYDKLVLTTGAAPVILPIDNAGLENIFSLHGVRDAEGIKALLARKKAHDVVIIGGGLISVEVTEALVRRGCRVTIVEKRSRILPMLDWEIAKLVERHMESKGVKVLTAASVTSFAGDSVVSGVITDKEGLLPADMVIVAVGVKPVVELARKAGLEIGDTGALKVDRHMRTADADIYAAGDCTETVNLVTGKPCYIPLGSTANKQARVAAVNICGGSDTFPGVLGSTVCKTFDYCVARTGLTEDQARLEGYDVITVLAAAPDRAHFMPTARILMMKLVVDRPSRRLLGVQAVGPGAGDKRIDTAAIAIAAGMTVDQIANADLCYAPPYTPAMDNLITAANVARNKLDGKMVGVTPAEVHRMLREKEDFIFLDVRGQGEYEQVRLEGSTWIPLGALRDRLGELPADKQIITFCNISLRGYEAAIILKAAGFQRVGVLDGGIRMWPYEKQ